MSHNISSSIPPQCVLWQWETVWSVSKPNLSKAQKAQHAAMQPCPALCLEQPSLHLRRQVTQIITSLHYLIHFLHSLCCFKFVYNCSPKIQNNIVNLSNPLPLLHWPSFEFVFTHENSYLCPLPSIVNQKELCPLCCSPTTTKCYCISSYLIILPHWLLFVTLDKAFCHCPFDLIQWLPVKSCCSSLNRVLKLIYNAVAP